MDKLRKYNEFNSKNLKTNINEMKSWSIKEQESVVDYIIRFLSKKVKFTENDYSLLEKNLKKYFIWEQGGLKKILEILIDIENDYIFDILNKYKIVYNEWVNDSYWWDEWINGETESEEDDEEPWYYYNKMKKFILLYKEKRYHNNF